MVTDQHRKGEDSGASCVHVKSLLVYLLYPVSAVSVGSRVLTKTFEASPTLVNKNLNFIFSVVVLFSTKVADLTQAT